MDEIIERINAGKITDGDVEALYHALWLKYYRYANKTLQDVHEAEDVVAEMFCRFLEKVGKTDAHFSTMKFLEAYLWETVRNLLWDTLRKRRRAIPTSSVEDRVESEEADSTLQELAQAIEQLEHPYNIILTLRYKEKWSLGRITEHLGISRPTLNVRLEEATTKLKAMVQGE